MTYPLSIYLRILRSASDTNNPQVKAGRAGAEFTGPAFARLANAMADFVDACREHDPEGYAGARDVLEGMVHRFPEVDTDADPRAILKARLVQILGFDPTADPTTARPAAAPKAKTPAPLDPDAFAAELDKMPSAEDPFDTKGDAA